MTASGMDPATAAERLGHTDGGALFLRRYRHLYDGEKRAQADRFGAKVQELLDEVWSRLLSLRTARRVVILNGRTWD